MIIKLLIEDETYNFEVGRLMLSEAMAIEDEWGLSPSRFETELTSGDPGIRVVGAVVWLVKVRGLAQQQGISFRDAARQLPVATFDVNLAAIRQGVEVPAENPTSPATRTPATPTTRRTSAAKRKPNA